MKLLLMISVACCFAFGGDTFLPAAVQSIPLHVTAPADVAAELELPMYVGLPLPATPAIQQQHVRLLDAAGHEVPLQTETLATWTKGGAVRWLGLHFIGRADGKYRVEVGDGVKPAAVPQRPLKIVESGQGIMIDTGVATFAMPKTGPLFSRIQFGVRTVVEGREGCLLVADQQGAVADETRGDAAEGPRVEVRGPLHAVVRRDGFFRTADGRRLGGYRVRLEYHAGLATASTTKANLLRPPEDATDRPLA